MFEVDFAPDVMCQLEQAVVRKLDYGGRQEAGRFLRAFEISVASLREDPLREGVHMSGIPRRYRVKSITPQCMLVYQIDEDAACVKVDGFIEESELFD